MSVNKKGFAPSRRLSSSAIHNNSRASKLTILQQSEQSNNDVEKHSKKNIMTSVAESISESLQAANTSVRSRGKKSFCKKERIEKSSHWQANSTTEQKVGSRKKMSSQTNPSSTASTKHTTTQKERKIVGALIENRRSDESKIRRRIPVVDERKSTEEHLKKRRTRLTETRKRRQKIEKERIEHLRANSGRARQNRLKKRSAEEKTKYQKEKHWIVSVAMGVRLQLIIDTVVKFRAYQQQLVLEDVSAMIITRQMRIYKFRRYRKRVKSAIYVLGSVFVIKVKIWKKTRRRLASDRVRAFLICLENENQRSCGCLALIMKGKKWRAYRQKIITLQRLWRERMRIITAQVLLVDMQWQREQAIRTEALVEHKFMSSVEKTEIENDKIDNINRTRKLVKMKPLPRRRCDTREMIRSRLLKGEDLLSVGHIVPAEMRVGIIRDMLRHLRLHHLEQMKKFDTDISVYHKEMIHIQQRRAILVGFSGSKVANAWVNAQHNERHLAVLGCGNKPQKPVFRVILLKEALEALISVGEEFVVQVRKSWNPSTMTISHLKYDGREAAEIHICKPPKAEQMLKP